MNRTDTLRLLRYSTLFFVPGAVVVLFVTTALVYMVYLQGLEDQAARTTERLDMLSIAFGDQIGKTASDVSYIVNGNDDIRILLTGGDQAEVALARLKRNFLALAGTKRIYDQIRVLDATGMEKLRVNLGHGVPYIVPDKELQDKSDRYYFSDAVNLGRGKVYLSRFDLNMEHGKVEVPHKPTIRFAAPVFADDDEVIGVVVINYLANEALHEFEHSFGDFDGNLYLVTDKADWTVGPDNSGSWVFMSGKFKEAPLLQMAEFARSLGPDDTEGHQFDDKGLWTYRELLADCICHQKVSGDVFDGPKGQMVTLEHWVALAHLSPAALRQPALEYARRSAVLVALILLVLATGSISIAYFLRNKRRMDEALRESREMYRSLVETAQDLIWRCDEEGRFIYLNDAWKGTHGYEVSEMLGRPFADFQDPEVNARDIKEFARHIAGGSVTGYQTTHKSRTGKDIHLVFNAIPRFNSKGEVIGTQGTAYDISHRVRAEQALERNLDRLREFAYAVAHDLKAPIIGVSRTATWLVEDHADKLDGNAFELLTLLKSRADRMVAMVQSILDYSLIGVEEDQFTRVDVSHLLDEVTELIGVPDSVTINYSADLPEVYCSRVALQRVFINLITNAIKHGGAEDLHISIEYEDVGSEYLFRVSDNGPGIAPEYHERVFVVFSTLHSRDDVEGSGIGLAIVKKMIEDSGGRIRLESAPGEGATFIFTIPKRKSAESN